MVFTYLVEILRQDQQDFLKQKAKEPIRLKSKSGMGKISHLGMESVNEVLKYPNDESKMLVAFLNTSVDGNKLKQVKKLSLRTQVKVVM